MTSAANWIVLVVVAMVALSPLGEIFDHTDEWPQDGSDVVFYIICLICFLGMSVRRGTAIIARLASSWSGALPVVRRPLLERIQSHVNSEERGLFLTFCDLRI